jgi:hypothetical protein
VPLVGALGDTLAAMLAIRSCKLPATALLNRYDGANRGRAKRAALAAGT